MSEVDSDENNDRMVIYADHYLLDWEREHKAINERWRNAARNGQPSLCLTCSFRSSMLATIELAASGTVPNETTMRAWKARKDAEWAAKKGAPEVKSDLLLSLEDKARG